MVTESTPPKLKLFVEVCGHWDGPSCFMVVGCYLFMCFQWRFCLFQFFGVLDSNLFK